MRREEARAERLLVFFDLPYAQGPDGIYCQDAFWIFLQSLGERFAELVVLGRMQTDDQTPRYRCEEAKKIVFHALPPFSSLYSTGEVLRGLPRLARRIWEPVGRCDAMLLTIPHPWTLVLWCVGRLRGKRIAFMARADLQELVKYRAPLGRRRRVRFAAWLFEGVFVRLSRTTLTFAVADVVARRYQRPRSPVHAILISTVRAAAIRPRAARGVSDACATRLLWVGRVDREKRPDLLLASFRDLCDSTW